MSSTCELIEPLPLPRLCVVGNHDLDDPAGLETFARVHGPMNFEFAHGHTRFVAIHSEPGVAGEVEVPGVGTTTGAEGRREEDLAFLDRSLGAAAEPHRVVLMLGFGERAASRTDCRGRGSLSSSASVGSLGALGAALDL